MDPHTVGFDIGPTESKNYLIVKYSRQPQPCGGPLRRRLTCGGLPGHCSLHRDHGRNKAGTEAIGETAPLPFQVRRQRMGVNRAYE